MDLLAGGGEPHRRRVAGVAHQPPGGQAVQVCPGPRLVDLQAVGHLGDELAAAAGPAAGRGQRQCYPLGLGQARPGQQPVQDRVQGLLRLADDLGGESRIGRHGCSSFRVGAICWLHQRWQTQH